MYMCKLCGIEFDDYGLKDYNDEENYYDNAIELADAPYTILYGCKSKNEKIFLVASGDGQAFYYPKYCSECGRKLIDNI